MTKEELSRAVAHKTGVSCRITRTVLTSIIDTISEEMCRGETIYLRGFGCFETKQGTRRRARNPQGEGLIEIPPKVRPVFRAYNDLKDKIQERLGRKVTVDFLCLTASRAKQVYVVGTFNDWSETATAMQKLPDGSWVAAVSGVAGQSIRYKYLIDGEMERDPAFPEDSRGNTLRQL